MKFFKIFFSIAVLAAITSSCRKDMPVYNRPNDYLRGDAASAFESFWTGMNSNYIFWGVDPTDWDAVYDIYQPKFARLDIDEEEDIVKLYEYLSDITKDLVDGHYSIKFNDDIRDFLINAGYNPNIIPSDSRHIKNGTYRNGIVLSQYIFKQLPHKYLSDTLRGLAIVDDNPLYMLLGSVNNTAGKDICYFYLSGFAITGYLNKPNDYGAPGHAPIDVILEALASALASPSLDGVIIDLRGNGGGYTDDLNILWGSLLTGKPFVAGYNRHKIGEGRLDYGPKVPVVIRPNAELNNNFNIPTNPHPVTAPIVVLADVNSVSCAEISTMALSHLPNGYFVGETTWGGQGVLLNNDNALIIHSGGTFNNFLMKLVYTPYRSFECVNGNSYEGKGFSPKDAPRGYEVKHNAAAIAAGDDPQLEKAIEIIINR